MLVILGKTNGVNLVFLALCGDLLLLLQKNTIGLYTAQIIIIKLEDPSYCLVSHSSYLLVVHCRKDRYHFFLLYER